MGGNLPSDTGPPQVTILRAIEDLPTLGIEVICASGLYQTPCFPAGAGPDFVNAAVLCQSDLGAHEILQKINKIEHKFGRERGERWESRTLDIDLLGIGDRVLPDRATFQLWRDLAPAAQQHQAPEPLIVPHPRMHERAFVLIPLAEIAPEWRHPVLGRSVSEMLEALPESDKAGIALL